MAGAFGQAARRFRPTLGMTLAAVPALGVLVGLGTWQIDRMHWKQALIAERAQRLAAALAPLPAAVANPEAFDFRRVQATGRFLHEKELYLANRRLDNRLGYHVITPLLRAEGGAVLVDRGFVPLDLKGREARPEGQAQGTVTVAGIARAPGAPGFFTPRNEPDRNFWFYVDIQAMAKQAGLDRAAPVLIEAGPQANPGGWPKGGLTDSWLADNHFVYALTWYGLALGLAAVYVLRSIREE